MIKMMIKLELFDCEIHIRINYICIAYSNWETTTCPPSATALDGNFSFVPRSLCILSFNHPPHPSLKRRRLLWFCRCCHCCWICHQIEIAEIVWTSWLVRSSASTLFCPPEAIESSQYVSKYSIQQKLRNLRFQFSLYMHVRHTLCLCYDWRIEEGREWGRTNTTTIHLLYDTK